MNASFSNLQPLPAFPHVEIHLEISRERIFTLLHITSATAHSSQECKGLNPYLTSVTVDSPKRSTPTYIWDCRNMYPLTLLSETEQIRTMHMRKMPYEKVVCNPSVAGHLKQWKSARVEFWHYDLFTTML